jgi:hypothetical protein
MVIDDAEFVENYSESGGGGLKASWVRLDIRNSVFRENQGGGSLNGALYTWGSQVRLLDVQFIGNYNVGLVTEASTLTLVGGHFFGNTGIWGPAQQVTKGGRALIVNSVYSGNRGSFGSAIYMEQDTPVDLVNSTISHNTATSDSASVFCWNCSVRILNSILWNVDGHPPQIGGSLTHGVAIGHSIIRGGLPVGAVDLGGNLEDDPLFTDPAGADGRIGTDDDDLSVGPGSAAVNRGDSSAIPPDSIDIDADGDFIEALPLDINGSARVQGNAVDIGAYELVPHTSLLPRDFLRPALLEIDPPFPNPFTSSASLRVSSRSASVEAVVIRVFDPTGRPVSSPRQVALPPGMVMLFQIGDASWPSGTYLVVIDHVSGRYTRRLTHFR